MADQKNKNFRKRLSLKNQEIQSQLISSGVVQQEEPKPRTENESNDPIEYFKSKNSEEIAVKDPMKFIRENKLNEEEEDKPKLLGSLANDEKKMIEKIKEGGDDLDLYEDVEEKPFDEKTLEEKNEKMKKRMEKALNENKK